MSKDKNLRGELTQRKILRDQVVALVKDFVQNEGGISFHNLEELFGDRHEVAIALAKEQIRF